MIRSRVLDVDPVTGRRAIHHYDDVTGLTTIEVIDDVEPVVDTNKYLQNDLESIGSQAARGKSMVHAASIPAGVWFELKKQGIVDDPVRYRKWLNDPENGFFRTSLGKV